MSDAYVNINIFGTGQYLPRDAEVPVGNKPARTLLAAGASFFLSRTCARALSLPLSDRLCYAYPSKPKLALVTNARARTHTRTHARTHARARTHTHKPTSQILFLPVSVALAGLA